MEFFDVVQKRQSVRRYKSDPIAKDVLNRIIEAVRRSPSWANCQPWELILVSDKSVKTALQATVPTYNPAFKAIIQAPILTCIIGILGTSGWYKGRTVTGRGDWFMFDCGIAAEHLALAAAAEELGTVHVGLFDYAKASQILALPDSRTVVELIPLGYPDHEPKRVNRKSPDEFVFYDTFG